MKLNKKIKVSLLLALLIGVVWVIIPSQDNSKNTIRILIDRMPLGLENAGQGIDSMGRQILPLIATEHYRISNWVANDSFELTPPLPQKPKLKFILVRDEITRAILFLKGDADVLYDSLAIAKTEWLKRNSPQAQIIEAPGLALSYLGFNLNYPLTQNLAVRKAIAMAIPLPEWIEYKLMHWVTPVEGMNLPSFHPELAEKMLDEAGYPVQPNGSRFQLKYYTTPVREGAETALLVQEALRKIKIAVDITTLETTLFFSKLEQADDYALFSARWMPLGPHEPINDLLGPTGKRNYTHYKDENFTGFLSKNPLANWDDSAAWIEQDLPFFPLYRWKHGLIVGPRILLPPNIASQLGETFRFFSEFDLK